MVLSRFEQTIQEHYSKLGIDPKTCNAITSGMNLLVDLCKGRIVDKKFWWFYYIILSHREYTTGMPDNVLELIERLRDAWWVEEEDIQQEIIYYILRPEVSLLGQGPLLLTIARDLRNYLIYNQRVFGRQNGWEDYYKYHDTAESPSPYPGIHILFMKKNDQELLSMADKYLIYLLGGLSMSYNEAAETLLRPIKDIENQLERIREKVHGRKNATRSSK